MADILVVDDSAIDRRLAGRLLEKEQEFSVRYAEDGVSALAAIEERLPDMVLTDIHMPNMDGLALVDAVRSRNRTLPILLMTSAGTEETAMAALEHGAAFYVPKRSLARELVDSVHRLLSLGQQQRTHALVMQCMTRSECNFAIDNNHALIPSLVSYLQACMTLSGVCDDGQRMQVGLALEEALLCAMYQGNLEITAEMRETDEQGYYDLVEERRREPPYCDRQTFLQATFSRDQAVFELRIEGHGQLFPSDQQEAPENSHFERNRGIVLLRLAMDEVRIGGDGQTIRLVKYRSAENPVELLMSEDA